MVSLKFFNIYYIFIAIIIIKCIKFLRRAMLREKKRIMEDKIKNFCLKRKQKKFTYKHVNGT